MQISISDSDFYKPSKELLAAINTALFLKRPLLLAGEPGTGKTACADFVARRLKDSFPDLFALERAMRFNTKSVSQSNDLFYSYDVVAHFGDKTGKPKESFISFNTLGVALLATQEPQKEWEKFANYKTEVVDRKPTFGSVVLIDEIDKAPRDFPNDLLAELEKPPFKFTMKEIAGFQVVQDIQKPVVVVITSNNEKGLPDAFLRRCVFHHINFPSPEELRNIVRANLKIDNEKIDLAIQKFLEFRKMNLVKKPATSELIDWIACLNESGLLNPSLGNWRNAEKTYVDKVKETLCILAKSKADYETISK